MSRRKVAVIYHSQQAGNTKAAAEAVAEGVRAAKKRFQVVMFNTNEARVDPTILAECAGVAFGTPDYFSYPAGALKVFMDDWLIVKWTGREDLEGMPVALFITHGGGGAAKAPFEALFGRVGSQVGETVAMRGAPDAAAVAACRALGTKLAEEAAKFARG